MEKTDGRKLKHDVLTELRKRAVARVEGGESPEVVVRTMGFNRACIYNWLAMYRAGGWDALGARKRGGRPRKLNGRIIAWIHKVVVESDPGQYGYLYPLWTRKAIAKLIYRQHHIRVSVNSVGRALAQLGITPQKPLPQAFERDPEQVRQHIEEKYPLLWHGGANRKRPACQMNRQGAVRLVNYLERQVMHGYTVVSWNGVGFDFEILAEESGMLQKCINLAANHVDMMFHILCQLGYAISLDSASRGMGLSGKRAGMTGAQIPRLWADGCREEVLEYVAQDVQITLQLAQMCELSPPMALPYRRVFLPEIFSQINVSQLKRWKLQEI